MIIIGISGLIAAGKSTLSSELSKFNIPVFDADKVVREAFSSQSVINSIKRKIPNIVHSNKINRKKLSDLAFHNKNMLIFLEGILHPIVRSYMYEFIKHHFYIGTKIIIIDIPLLFESNINNICDYTILVKCSIVAQKYRYLKRDNSSVRKLKKILEIQQKNIFKEKKAHFILDTTLSKTRNFAILKKIITQVKNYEGSCSGYRNYRIKSRRWRSSY